MLLWKYKNSLLCLRTFIRQIAGEVSLYINNNNLNYIWINKTHSEHLMISIVLILTNRLNFKALMRHKAHVVHIHVFIKGKSVLGCTDGPLSSAFFLLMWESIKFS